MGKECKEGAADFEQHDFGEWEEAVEAEWLEADALEKARGYMERDMPPLDTAVVMVTRCQREGCEGWKARWGYGPDQGIYVEVVLASDRREAEVEPSDE